MKLRDLPAELEAALGRLTTRQGAQRPYVAVDAREPQSSIFIQYYGAFERPIYLQLCFNHATREIPDLEETATEWFGAKMVIAPDETYGYWTKECPSITRAVEHGMFVFRHILQLGWDTELFIEEGAQTPKGGVHA